MLARISLFGWLPRTMIGKEFFPMLNISELWMPLISQKKVAVPTAGSTVRVHVQPCGYGPLPQGPPG